MIEKNFIPGKYNNVLKETTFQAIAPSNIALVKYWGKLENQIPANASVSFSLTNCHTKTKVQAFEKESNEKFDFKIYFEGKENVKFREKILSFFEKTHIYLPFLSDYKWEIHSENSFPHSSGIASSASSMAALALCFMQAEKALSDSVSLEYFQQKASFLARLGSGSACRSLYPQVVVWGKHEEIAGSSHLYGVPFPKDIHPVFQSYRDTILLIDKGQKQVSSSQGHQLMHGHSFATQRFQQAQENISKITQVFQSGDLEKFIEIVESEALTLHAMMMTSLPYFILMKPNTLSVIEKVWRFRKETGTPICFTLDAGANVHLLFPKDYTEVINTFIQEELLVHCENGQCISDEVCIQLPK